MRFQVDFISIKGSYFSKHLARKVKFRWVAPSSYRLNGTKDFPVLLMNDGQDYTAMKLEKTLSFAYSSKNIKPFIYVGIETDRNRIHEYGTVSSPDFKGRGEKAVNYSRFIIEEFIPFLKEEFKVSHDKMDWVYCGMSLGGLSAFDIVYRHPDRFGKVAVFSGSFWWRHKAYVKNDLADRSRIVLNMIKDGKAAPHLKFWFQVGTLDEKADRNRNGIIDAIDDVRDVIKELKKKGYSEPGDIKYVEIDGGKHDLPTWAGIYPEFILWAFAKASPSAQTETTPQKS